MKGKHVSELINALTDGVKLSSISTYIVPQHFYSAKDDIMDLQNEAGSPATESDIQEMVYYL